MNRKDNSLKSPANEAVQHYLDDLMFCEANVVDDSVNIREVENSIAQAQKLLQQANSLHLDLSKSSQVVADEVEKAKASSEANNNVRNELTGIGSVEIDNSIEKTAIENKENQASADINTIGEVHESSSDLCDRLSTRFQALLCDISGVTIAIPLVELGSIQQLSKLNSIAGKPAWFKGVLVKGEQKFNCIDASSWLVPKKNDHDISSDIEYKFGVQLGKTPFLLCCNEVSNTIELSKEDVKWRTEPQKRLWLAGLVKKEMCALIDGASMVQEVLSH